MKLTSVVLMVLLPAAQVFGETAGIMLYPQGTVTVNGAPVSRTQAGFEGDRCQTAKDSSLVMTGLGSSIQVAPSSEVVYHAAGLRLHKGGAAITTQRRLAAQVANLSIRPLSDEARYSIAQNEKQVVIGAEQGAVVVSDGVTQLTIPQGKAFVGNLEALAAQDPKNDQSQTQSQDDQNKDRKRRAAGAPPAAGVGVSLSKGALIAIAAGVGAGVIALAILLANRQPASDP